MLMPVVAVFVEALKPVSREVWPGSEMLWVCVPLLDVVAENECVWLGI
jgi:hypothetical protein